VPSAAVIVRWSYGVRSLDVTSHVAASPSGWNSSVPASIVMSPGPSPVDSVTFAVAR
jgi:hypothetical protein